MVLQPDMDAAVEEGAVTQMGLRFRARAVVLTAGTSRAGPESRLRV